MNRRIGAIYLENSVCEFTVWAPLATKVELEVVTETTQSYLLQKETPGLGYWTTTLSGIAPGTLYFFSLDGKKIPDIASMSQPQDVHGPSEVINHASFEWQNTSWKGIDLKDMVIYELHVGTFTPEGTFDAAITRLEYLKELGINTIELLPVNQFPGNQNWGYDGVFPFAVQHSYGGPDALKRFIDACHKVEIGVLIDAVYNHIGPDGNYFNEYGPYFTSKYTIPWGNAINLDDAYSDEVRNYFIQNALMWVRDYQVDGFRLDAVHAYKDMSARHFLQDLTTQVKELAGQHGRKCILIGECDLNDPKYITPVQQGGYGLDGQWCDEFHHALHTIITGEKDGYYEDFGSVEHLGKAYSDSYVYTGEYSPHRKKSFGVKPDNHPYWQFVVFAQNHDQIGNRLTGDRISQLAGYEGQKLSAAAMLLSPAVPLVFMGEEFGEENTFQYFCSHTNQDLIEAVREGRKKEFEYFNWQGEIPDPQSEETFLKAKLNWDYSNDKKKSTLFALYKKLIAFRKTHPVYRQNHRGYVKAVSDEKRQTLELVYYLDKVPAVHLLFNFSKETRQFQSLPEVWWTLFLNSAAPIWLGEGKAAQIVLSREETLTVHPESVLVYTKQSIA